MATIIGCHVIIDPLDQYVSDVPTMTAMRMLLAESEDERRAVIDDMYRDIKNRYQAEALEHGYTDVIESMVFTDAGYVYVQATLGELKRTENRKKILVQLMVPGANRMVHLVLSPRRIGYGYQDLTYTTPDDQPIILLVATPSMVKPGVFEQVDCINGKYMTQQSIQYR